MNVTEYLDRPQIKSQAIFACGCIVCGDMLEMHAVGGRRKTNTDETK